VRFIKSSQEMIKAGDEEATAVFNQFGKIPMPDHMHFSDDEVKSIVAYIKDESAPTAAAVAPAPVTQVATTATTMAETATTTAPSTLAILFNGSSQSNIVLIMMGMILLLVLITVPMLIKAAIILRNLE
jgi:cytochrome c oxidase cbb3-type subunit III